MTPSPHKLNYERPDIDRALGNVSPLAQTLLGFGSYVLIVLLAVLANALFHAPAIVLLLALASAVAACIWTYYRWHWPEFCPAMVIGFIITLMAIPIVGVVGWLVF